MLGHRRLILFLIFPAGFFLADFARGLNEGDPDVTIVIGTPPDYDWIKTVSDPSVDLTWVIDQYFVDEGGG